jgi:hypothetical protein
MSRWIERRAEEAITSVQDAVQESRGLHSVEQYDFAQHVTDHQLP